MASLWKILESDCRRTTKVPRDYGQLIEEQGQAVQSYAQEFQLCTSALSDTPSSDMYDQAVQAHLVATRAHLYASKVYTQLVKLQLQYRKSH